MVKEARFNGEAGYEFSEDGLQVLKNAEEEARRLWHNYIGTEHILLGLIRNDQVNKTLAGFGLVPGQVRIGTESIMGRGHRKPEGEIGLTPRSKKVLQFAFQDANRSNIREISPLNLLRGVLYEGEGIGAGVLESLGVTREKVSKFKSSDEIKDEVMRDLQDVLGDPNVSPESKRRIEEVVEKLSKLAQII